MRVLLVEDDAPLRRGLYELLTGQGYAVVTADCRAAAEEKWDAGIDLVILDVALPDGDGVDLCRAWRSRGIGAPILFLTAKDEESDIVQGLDAGGNDYVTKPFRMREFLSRIRALLRRDVQAALTRDGITLLPDRMQAERDGVDLNLTATEFRLLHRLMAGSGTVTRAVLLDGLWDSEGKFVDDNTLSVHISRLRDKVGADRIKTVRGVGYRWCSGS